MQLPLQEVIPETSGLISLQVNGSVLTEPIHSSPFTPQHIIHFFPQKHIIFKTYIHETFFTSAFLVLIWIFYGLIHVQLLLIWNPFSTLAFKGSHLHLNELLCRDVFLTSARVVKKPSLLDLCLCHPFIFFLLIFWSIVQISEKNHTLLDLCVSSLQFSNAIYFPGLLWHWRSVILKMLVLQNTILWSNYPYYTYSKFEKSF